MSTFYRPMGSYSLPPHQRNYASYPNHCYPSWEMALPQINGGPGRPPVMNEPWSCGGGYGYFNPAECHGCCTNSYFPVWYGFGTPHSHLLPPPIHHHHHGPYPPYHDVHSHYCVPPPHYSFGQPRYEYDKNVPDNHCCGCPNHKCGSKVDSNVKIEEQGPEVEKAKQKSSEPIKSGEYQNPVVWIPPGYVKEDGSLSSKPGPQVWSGWLPFGMSNTKSLKQGGEEREKQDENNEENRIHFPYPIMWMPANEKPQEAEAKDLKDVSSVPKYPEETPSKQYQQNEEKRDRFPFPFFWIPAYDKRPEAEMKDVKEVSQGPKSAEEAHSKLKTIPVKDLQNDDRGEKPAVADDTSGIHARVAEEELKPKSIPVKQTADFEEKKSSGGTETTPKSIPVKHMEENANKPSNGTTKSQPGSPKASKLSPVCLRVDPLPRRKNGNGTSRSQSPPGEKEKLQKQSDSVKESRGSKMQDPRLKVSEEQAVKNNKEVESQGSKMQDPSLNVSQEQAVKNNKEAVEIEVPEILVEKDVEVDDKEQKIAKEAVESKTEKVECARKNRKDISVSEAAVLIQSAYRGYEVRKWEPLKKLRQVRKVHEQVEEVRERIRALESSPELQRDEKQKVIIGETIMGLLLQLDVIQGLHPSLRDIRKSVARDLVSLQERLDSVASQVFEESKLMMDAPMNSAKQVVENPCETNVNVGVPLGRDEEEKPSELSKAPSSALHGCDIEPNGPTKELESEEPILEEEHTGSPGDEVVVPLTNEVLADSREQYEEKLLEPPLEPPLQDEEAEKDSGREPTNTAVEPCMVGKSTGTLQMGFEKAESEGAVSIDMKDEEENINTGPVALVNTEEVKNEVECKPQGLDELPLVVEGKMDSTGDQLKESIDDVNQSSTLQVLPVEALEGTQSSDSEQDVDHVTVRREESESLNSDSDVEPVVRKEDEVLVKSLEFADSDSKPESSDLQPSGWEDSGDSLHILQQVEESHEEKLVEDQVVASVDSSHAVSILPSDSTNHVIALQAEGMEVIVKESKDNISETELPQIDGCIVKEVGKDCLPSIQFEATEAAWEAPYMTEKKDGTDGLGTVTSDEVDHKLCGSEMVEGVITSPAAETKEEINGGDHKPCGSEMVEGAITSPAAETKEEINGGDHKPCGSELVEGVITSSPAEMEGEITISEPVAEVSHEQAPKILDVVEDEQVHLHDKGLVEDNEKLKEMLEKLVQAGKEQLSVISDLNGRIKDLERKLKSKKKMRMRQRRVAAVSSSAKRSNGLAKGNVVSCAA